jgi:hypothetical protein
MNRLWIQEIAVYVFILAKWLLSVNPLLNGLIYAGFIRRYRARVLLLLHCYGMPWRWRWRRKNEQQLQNPTAIWQCQDQGDDGVASTKTKTVAATTKGPSKHVPTKRVTT